MPQSVVVVPVPEDIVETVVTDKPHKTPQEPQVSVVQGDLEVPPVTTPHSVLGVVGELDCTVLGRMEQPVAQDLLEVVVGQVVPMELPEQTVLVELVEIMEVVVVAQTTLPTPAGVVVLPHVG